jgi:hypothetical protein
MGMDAVHVACAEEADHFVSRDDVLVKRLDRVEDLKALAVRLLEFISRTVVHLLSDPQLSAGFSNLLALAQQNLGLAQFPDNLLGSKCLPLHPVSPALWSSHSDLTFRLISGGSASPGEFAREDADETAEHDVSQEDFEADDKCCSGRCWSNVAETEGGKGYNAVIE